MSLSNIKVGKKGNLPERVIIVGGKGMGKSAFGAECEILPNGMSGPASKDVIFIPTEDGCSNIEGLNMFEQQSTYSGVLNCCEQLLKEDHKFKSVVIDTLDSLYRTVCIGVTNNSFDKSTIKFNQFGQGDKVVAMELKRLLDVLDQLRDKKKMKIVILAHSGIVNRKNATGDDYIKNSADIGKNTWGLFFGWADRVGFADYEFKTKGGDDAEGKKGKVIQRDNKRYIWFGGSAAIEAKTRVGYELNSDKIEFTYKAYKEATMAKAVAQ